MNNKYVKLLILVAAFLILSLSSLASYAYFTAKVTGNEEATKMVITSGHMEVEFDVGNVITTGENMLPGETITKTFNVTNTGDVDATYNIYLNEVFNTFVNKDELVYELTDENGVVISQREVPSTSGAIKTNVTLEVAESHYYELTITFLNKEFNQDENKGALFTSKIELEEGINYTTKDMTVYYFTDDRNTADIYGYDITSYGSSVNYIKTTGKAAVIEANEIYGIEVTETSENVTCAERQNDSISLYAYNYTCEDVNNNAVEKQMIYRYNNEIARFTDIDSCNEFINNNLSGQNVECKLYSTDEPINIVYKYLAKDKEVCIYSNNTEKCLNGAEQWDYDMLKSQQVKSFKQKVDNLGGFECEYSIPEQKVICKDQYSDYVFVYKQDEYNEGLTTIRAGTLGGYMSMAPFEARMYDRSVSYSSLDECFEQTQENHSCSKENGVYYDYQYLGTVYSMQQCTSTIPAGSSMTGFYCNRVENRENNYCELKSNNKQFCYTR